MQDHIEFIRQLVAQGGPALSDYEVFNDWLHVVARKVRDHELSQHDIQEIRTAFGYALSEETIQGFGYKKPHGYPGDYEMLEKLYLEHVSSDASLANWDNFFHWQRCVIAVRNRKQFFICLLKCLEHSSCSEQMQVLDLASGPARCECEFLRNDSTGKTFFDCVDFDGDAIAYAKNLCREHLERINFYNANVFRFKTRNRYQLIWSAGLFDYFDDKQFKFLLKRLVTLLDIEGELVIGNFSPDNPTRDYMEIVGDWYLYYRTQNDLMTLAQDCGISATDIRITQEPEEIILFLHIKRGNNFIPLSYGKEICRG
ncbi:MAG: class I SAM-dependent methyltransferase [Caldilineaceae bacterium]